MDDFFKNIRSTPVNVGNLIEEPGVSENKIQLLNDIETKPEDYLNQLPTGDTPVSVNQQCQYELTQFKRNALSKNENPKPCEVRPEIDRKDKCSLKPTEIIGPIDKPNRRKDTKDEVISFRSKIYDSISTKTISLLDKVTTNFSVFTKEEGAPFEEEGQLLPFDILLNFINL
ncbi:uncharacterized protein LOC118263408 isoform X1 [Spodoptera frugiperda]|uniref:Uncharacterized protein LOC118263408 isoform X1 n=1 Tax=Spodoptera frugiperda TaxID=7108 RepID=A0A9R0CW72_SPOFR|nr:uncharacterized protein LOC118263408 isoform X1 [Spodoptera frugiperda]